MKKRILAMVLATGMVLSAGLTGCGSETASSTSTEDETEAVHDEDYYIEQIQNGYLGTYSTVSVKDVFEAIFPDGSWHAGTMEDDEYFVTYIWYTDYDEQELIVSFEGNDDGSETFELTDFYYVYSDGVYDSDEDDMQDISDALNLIYYNYALFYEDSGISEIYYDTRGFIFEGHFGPLTDEQTLPEDVDESSETVVDVSPEGLAAWIEESVAYYGLSIDEMRVLLYSSENAYYTEEEVDVMPDAVVLDAYINLIGDSDEPEEETVTEDTVEETDLGDIDYAGVYDYAFGEINESVEYGYYCLWDLNDDGIYELILGHGESSADYVNDVWTVGDDGGILGVGSFYGDTMLYVAPDYNGIYSVYGHMDYQTITRITMVDGEIEEEIISEGELSTGEDYYSNEMEIYLSDISDRSLLDQY